MIRKIVRQLPLFIILPLCTIYVIVAFPVALYQEIRDRRYS